jgi:hypothetical protein
MKTLEAHRPLRKIAHKNSFRMLPAMPLTIRYDGHIFLKVASEKQRDDIVFRFDSDLIGGRDGQHPDSPKVADDGTREIDAYQLRESFLDVRTHGEALELLSFAGHFRRPRLSDGKPTKNSRSLSWTEFKQWQEVVRLFIAQGLMEDFRGLSRSEFVGVAIHLIHHDEYSVPATLLPLVERMSDFEICWLGGFPDQLVVLTDEPTKVDKRPRLRASVIVESLLEAVLATVYLDKLSGIDYHLCALPDCQKLYEVNSKHERQYCSQACAHKASVRRRRAEAKVRKDSAKRMKIKSKERKG